MVLLAIPIDAQERFLREILGLLRAADQVLQHGHQAMMVQVHQLRKRVRIIGIAHPEHQPDVRVPQCHLCAGLAGESHAAILSVTPR